MADEGLLKFPCEFPIKAMGRGIIGLEDTIVSIVRKHAVEGEITSVRTRPSRNGRFISVTITIRANSRQQLDSIYMDLTAHPDVLMSF